MRRITAIVFATFITACSSPEAVVTPPPPPSPTPGAPATVTIVTGDGQTAAPGAVLPVKLSVLVKDAAGIAVPSVTVHFAIDSGAGSLSTSSVTTASDGTASGVTWTLGAAGSNVVAVTVNALAPVRFHAQGFGTVARTIFENTSIGSGGGTFTYTKAGDALNGLSVTVKPGTFATSSSWSIVADTTLAVTLPAGFSQVGPTLVINTGQGFGDSVMTLTMPLHVGTDMAVVPFYYDPGSGTLEAIPLIARTPTSATLATHHFSADLMAIPGAGATGSLRASLRQGFGAVQVIWVDTPQSDLVGTYSSTFKPGTDDWEFVNYGDFISPGGDCAGMSISAMYYHYFFRLGNAPKPPLYHKYDQSITNQWDNVQGIRFAGSVQGDFAASWKSGMNAVAKLQKEANDQGASLSFVTASWIVMTLKLTHHPVLIYLSADNGDAHAVVAYAVTSDDEHTVVSLADPNRPANQSVTLTYDFGLLDPVNFQDNANDPPELYTTAVPIGASANVSVQQLGARWAEFSQQKAGQDRYPKHYRIDIQNQFDLSWSQVPANVVSYSQSIVLRTICTDCAAPADSVQPVAIWDGGGTTFLVNDAFLETPGPAQSFMALAYALPVNAKEAGFVDAFPITVMYQKLIITSPEQWLSGVPLAFSVQNPPNLAGAHYKFEWDFGDGTALGVATDNPNITHTFANDGSPTVTVAITDLATGHVIARAATSSNVGPIESFIHITVGGTWPPGIIPPDGFYQYTDSDGPRQAGTPTLDALGAQFDRVGTSAGVNMFVVVPTGASPTKGQVFTMVQSGQPQAGQFVLSMSINPADPVNSPVGTAALVSGSFGTLTINAVTPVGDGSSVYEYTISILSPTGGSILASGAERWR